VRHNDFVRYDDHHYITENPNVRQGVSRESLLWAITKPHGAMWHPLTMLSHVIDCELFGLDPAGHHAVSVVLHAAAALVLFGLLKAMTGSVWPSLFTAAVFALHPVHVESVAWASERKDVLSALFWMLTLAAYAGYAKHRGRGRYTLALALFTAGLTAKPMLVTLPFVLLLVDYWPLGRLALKPAAGGRKGEAGLGHLVREKVPFFAVAAVFAAVTYIVQRSWGATGLGGVLPIGSRIANAAVAYTAYIQRILWPANLAALYPYPAAGWGLLRPAASLLILVVVSVPVLKAAGRFRYLATGWFWYLGTLVPVIGLVQVGRQSTADRYTYIPSIGLCIMAAWGLPGVLGRWRYRRPLLAAGFVAAAAAMTLATRAQVGYWKDSVTLFGRAAAVTRDNTTMLKNLGNELWSAGRYKEAVGLFDEAIAIDARDTEAMVCKARALMDMDRVRQAEAVLSEALRIRPGSAEAHNWLGAVRARKGLLPEAIACYRRAIELKGDYAAAHNNLGIALNDLGRTAEAVESYRRAIGIKGDYAEAHSNLGLALQSAGRNEEAVAEFNTALSIKPGLPEALKGLGKALLASGRTDDAIALYRRVLSDNPSDESAVNDLGAAFGQKGDDEKAIEHFKKALDIRPGYPDAMCNLAVALYKKGRLDEAVEKLDRVLEANPGHVRAAQLKAAITAAD
jgi:tetratricopeptide (TPR) repeat protein